MKKQTLSDWCEECAGQILAAVRQSHGTQPLGERVHQARLGIKRMRALVRALGENAPSGKRRKFDRRLRSSGRSLSGYRDLDVAAGQLRKLQLKNREAALCREIEYSLVKEFPGDSVTEAFLHKTIRMLERSAKKLPDVCKGGHPDAALRTACECSYRKARRRYRKASIGNRVADLHALRKRVKDLLYQLRFIPGEHAARLERYESELKNFSDLLGDFQNSSMLLRMIRDRSVKSAASPGSRRLQAELNEERRELGRRALSRASRLFVKKPGIWVETVLAVGAA